MENVLLLLHSDPLGQAPTPARECLSAAQHLAQSLPDARLSIAWLGDNPAALTELALSPVSRLFQISGPDFNVSRFNTDAAAVEAFCRTSEATLVIAPASTRWARCLPAVAWRLGGRADTHVTGLKTEGGHVEITRWFYKQRLEGSLRREQRPWFILVEPGTFPPAQGAPTALPIETIPVALPAPSRTRVAGIKAPPANAQTIRPDADLLFVAGAGWTKKQADGQSHASEAETIIRDFITRARASLGSSKSLVDLSGEGQAVLSFLTHLNQVGQTGSTPRHPKGLAACCHGEEPHTVGWRFIRERRAINLDPNCGWARGKADVLYVADAFKVMQQVNQLLGSVQK